MVYGWLVHLIRHLPPIHLDGWPRRVLANLCLHIIVYCMLTLARQLKMSNERLKVLLLAHQNPKQQHQRINTPQPHLLESINERRDII